jgi:chromosome segregation ATPase
MNDIKELQETITNLEKEKDILQEEIAKDMVKNSDLIIQNQNLQQENDKLKEENEKLKQEIQSTEKVVLEIADKLYKQEFNVENIVEVVDNE